MDNVLSKFLFFFLFAVPVYHLINQKWQIYWLLLASYVLYASWSWHFLAVLLVMTLVNYWLGILLENTQTGFRRVWLWVGILFNIISLVFFKYNAIWSGFFSRPADTGIQEILLPIGLSFLILQTISYLVDIYRGQLEASRNLIHFALYLAYFPKLISGPIERARSFLPQIAAARPVTQETVRLGLDFIILGLIQKMLIADPLRQFLPAGIFEEPARYPGPILIMGLLAFSFSLYADFAGYTSIARGISSLLGIELSPNFKQPYLARSFSDFWNRWHISFSCWLRDYIYYPLSRHLLRRKRGRKSLASLTIPPLVTMLVSGLWHGVAWNMLLWGLLHGLYQIGEQIPTLWRVAVPYQDQPLWKRLFKGMFVFGLVILAWIPFALPSDQIGNFIKGCLNFQMVWYVPDAWLVIRVVSLILLALVIDLLSSLKEKEVFFQSSPLFVRAAITGFTGIALLIMLSYPTENLPEFVYQGF